MKNSILIILFILICSSAFGELQQTKTMNTDMFSDLKDACVDSVLNTPLSGNDEVMTYYHDVLIDPNRDGEEEWIEQRASFEPINQVSYYAKLSLLGAIGRGYDSPNTWEQNLSRAKNMLLQDPFYDLQHPDPDMWDVNMYLNLDEVWDEYEAGITRECLSLGSLLQHVSFIVDMLWYYVSPAEQDSLRSKLNNIAYYVNHMLNQGLPTNVHNGSGGWVENLDPNLPEYYPDWLQTYFSNGRIRLAGALGYAGCVLDSLNYINTAENDLFERTLPTGDDGFIELQTTNGGFYSEGISYTRYTFKELDLFLTARKRIYDVDWFSDVDSHIPELFVNDIYLTAPDFGPVPFDDVTISHIKLDGTLYRPRPFFQMVTYFYHSDESDYETRNLIKWLLDEYNTQYATYFGLWDFRRLYVYNSERVLGGGTSLPSHFSQGTYYSNEEFTIFRKSISTPNEFYNSPTLIVNHENSVDYGTHEDSDQSSFILYYKGKPIVIDPGYEPSNVNDYIGKEWLSSPFAHNLIMVNPTCTDTGYSEVRELFDDYTDLRGNYNVWNSDSNNYNFFYRAFEPIGCSTTQLAQTAPKNPAYKNYFISNENIQHLQLGIIYDHVLPYSYSYNGLVTDTISIKRNFYAIDIEDNSYFVIYDDVESSDNNNSNEFMNQLHFALYPVPVNNNEYSNNPDNIDEPGQQEGKFTYTSFDDSVKLFGTMGSQNNSSWIVLDSLPQGLYKNDDDWNYNFTPPQWEHKCLRIYTETTGDEKFLTVLIPSESGNNPITVVDSTSYYAVEIYDTSKSPTEKSYYAVSDSILDISFADIDINSDAAFVGLTYRPGYQYNTKITRFIMAEGDSLLYNDTTLVHCSNVNEIIAEYSGTELSVIVKSDDEYPQYKILRQGVDPDDFSSIGVADQGNGSSNIEHLSYDNNYFYVNWYDFSSGTINLSTPIYVPDGDILVIGNNVTINCTDEDVKFEIEGEISIGNNVTFTSPDSVYWDGIYLENENAQVEIDSLTLIRGKLYNDSYEIEISNSDFISSGIYHEGREFVLEYSDFDSSNVVCEWLSPFTYENMVIDISNCTFEDYSDSVLYAIDISGYPDYFISDNTINNCSGGISLDESGSTKACTIEDNEISYCSSNGILLYHSSGDIICHNDIEENVIGLVSTHNSSLRMEGAQSGSPQTISNSVYEEIKLDIDSVPEQDLMTYNYILDDSLQSGSNDQYFINCIRFRGPARSIYVEGNYWCDSCTSWSEWTADDFFQPDTAFDYIPVWEAKREMKNSYAKDLYYKADSLIVDCKFDQAKYTYQSIIDQYPHTPYAMYSMRNLYSLETRYGQDFQSLKQYYLTDPNCNLNADRKKLSQYLANYCAARMEEFVEAITFYEDIILNPDTILDSIYAVIDLSRIYLMMENSSKSYKGRLTYLIPNSVQDYRNLRGELLNNLLEIHYNE